MRSALVWLLVLGLGTSLLAACGGGEGEPISTPTSASPPKSTTTSAGILVATTVPPPTPVSTSTPTPLARTPVDFPSAVLTQEAIQYHQNLRQIINEFTKGVVDGQIEQGATPLSAITGGRRDLIMILYLHGLETGPGFELGLIKSSFEQLGDVAVSEIKGNLSLLVNPVPPEQRSSQEDVSPGRARLATLDPVLQSFEQGNTRTYLATGDQPWGQPSPILRQIPIKLSSRGTAGRGLAGARPLLSNYLK